MRDVIRDLGFWRTITYGTERVLRRISTKVRLYHYDLVVQPVPSESLLPSNLGQSILVREIPSGDPSLELMRVPRSTLQHRFRQPVVCLGAFKDQELMAYLWLCLGPYDEDEVRCLFDPRSNAQAAWDFDVFVCPQHRRSLAFARIWDAANAYLRKRGIRYTFSRIASHNTASRLAHEKLKARRVATALYLKGKAFQVMIATLPPYVHVSLSQKKRPVLQLPPPG